MSAWRAAVVSRGKENMMFLSALEDFTLGERRKVDPEILRADPAWSLYCLHFETDEALFVRTPCDLDLTGESFLFQAQFKHAQEVAGLRFEDLHPLARHVSADDRRMVFVHSVGRCGSTLVSKAFSAVPATCSLSEPDVPTQLTLCRGRGDRSEKEIRALLESSTRLYCKPWPGRTKDERWVFKYRAQCIELADWLMDAFPGARQLFLRRRPLDWLHSIFRAFVDPAHHFDPAYAAKMEEIWAMNFPLFQERAVMPGPRSAFKVWMLLWIAIRRTQARHEAAGYPFHHLDYEALCQDPEGCLEAVFRYCGMVVDDWQGIRTTLQRDAQAGTTIARDAVDRPDRIVPAIGIDEARSVLRHWGFAAEASAER